MSESLGDGIQVTFMFFFVGFCIPLISHKKTPRILFMMNNKTLLRRMANQTHKAKETVVPVERHL